MLFKLQNDALIQGHAELIDPNHSGKLKLKDPSKVKWEDKFPKVDCSSIAQEIKYSREVAQSIAKEH